MKIIRVLILISVIISILIIAYTTLDAGALDLVRDSSLHNDLHYYEFEYKDAGVKLKAHLIKMKLDSKDLKFQIIKSGSHSPGLEKLINIVDSIDKHTIEKLNGNCLCGVNAGFWRASDNYPIGPLVINGIPVSLNRYKSWSSIFFNDKSVPFIDTLTLTMKVITEKGAQINIDYLNRRRDSSSIVFYNRYFGNKAPDFDKMFEDYIGNAGDNAEFRDITDFGSNIDDLADDLKSSAKYYIYEEKIPHIHLTYLNRPFINDTLFAVVTRIDSGIIELAPGNAAISMGGAFPAGFIEIGDTLRVLTESNIHRGKKIADCVSATPRLVRNGNAKHEAVNEGVTGNRFIYSHLPRTAIGFDKKKEYLFLVVVEPGKSGFRGANLGLLSNLMKELGCYDAMNLDGGGSTQMLVGRENILYPENPEIMRKVNSVICIINRQ